MTTNNPIATSDRTIAAAHIVTRIPRTTPGERAGTVIDSLHGQDFECADTVFVTDSEGRLEGIVRLKDLFADDERLIADIMLEEHEAVRLDDDQEQIALLAVALDMIAVPVVDDDGKLIGAVPPDALLGILRAEHMEDMMLIAGITAHEHGPEIALNAPLKNRLRRRLPWLMFGLFASSVMTVVMAGFEESLSANIAVAFFIPAIIYMVGAIGTQAVSVAVRGLSTEDISLIALLKGELVIGLAIGAALGTVSFGMVFVSFEDVRLALAVGLAILIGGAASAVVGFALPWVFNRLGSDPALGSGPICTIIQDAASLAIYFILVSALLL